MAPKKRKKKSFSKPTRKIVIKKAVSEPEFREGLLKNPKESVEKLLGHKFRRSVNVHVVQEDPDNIYIVLPVSAYARSDASIREMPDSWFLSVKRGTEP
ncbi:NHLP leader peptide family RiPP precursor [Trinickia sp. EG282A]|uniref:NHLP leader peptide family RiPP precursor n=1 Tax=Trinickia sp. EG282A TaxID=3237013 RepID=UPI0034D35C65